MEKNELDKKKSNFELGLYYKNKGGLENLEKSIEYFKLSEKENDSNGICALGDIYLLQKKYNLAYNYYLSSAKLKNSSGYLGLGNLYKYGLGVNKDLEKCFENYMVSSELKNPMAQYYVGICYELVKNKLLIIFREKELKKIWKKLLIIINYHQKKYFLLQKKLYLRKKKIFKN
jgi:hypothetical protein